MTTNTAQSQMIREAMQAIAERKPGKSKLVYDKTKRTIVAVAEGTQTPKALNITADDADMFGVATLSAAWLRGQWPALREAKQLRVSFSSWDDGDALTHSELCVQSSPDRIEGVLLLGGQKDDGLSITLTSIEPSAPRRAAFIAPDGVGYRAEAVDHEGRMLEVEFADVEPQLDLRRSGILETTILKDKTALCIGLGTGGAFVAVELAKCGVGRFVLVDRDSVNHI